MGVHGLWNVLNQIQLHIPLRSLGGKKVAIDLSGWICGDICVNQRVHTVCKLYIRNLVFRLIALLREGILPVAITDGIAPAVKAPALRERQNTSRLANLPNSKRQVSLKRSHFNRISSKTGLWETGNLDGVVQKMWCSELLKILGVPCIASPGEAEAMCAFLNTENLVDGCVTNDGDAFLYGAKVVYRHFSLNPRDASVEAYYAEQVESRLGLCRESLVLLGLILGCDYWPSGVPGVGPISAGKLLSQVDVSEALHRLASTTEVGTNAGSSYKASGVEEDVWRSSTWRKVATGLAGCSVTKILEEFLLPWEARGWKMPPETSLVWSRPDVRRAVELCVNLLDWQPSYALAQFTPLLALWIIRSKSPSSLSADTMEPLRIIRKRSVHYIPCFEVEWSRLKDDIWSEALLTSDPSPNALSTTLTGFFTSSGYRFTIPCTEFRTAFPHLVLIFESLSIRSLTAKMDNLVVNGRGKGRKQCKKTMASGPLDAVLQQNTENLVTAASLKPSSHSSPQNCLRKLSRTPPPLDTVFTPSPVEPPLVGNFISVRLSSQFERRLTLQSSLLAATPPPPQSPATAEFSGFRTPVPLVNRLA